MEPLFLKPIFMDRIWGGTALKDKFNYEIDSPTTGECWAISSHKNGDCLIENGKYKGKKLSELWNKNRELFGNTPGDKFPLLTKYWMQMIIYQFKSIQMMNMLRKMKMES